MKKIFCLIYFLLPFNSVTNEQPKKACDCIQPIVYRVKEELRPSGLIGISDAQVNDHWNLYKGYVNNANLLNKELAELRNKGEGNSLDYADRRRRYGFEYNGIVLHELYFENLSNKSSIHQVPNFLKCITQNFGSFNKWYEDFVNAGKTRGIGWVITAFDPSMNNIVNLFIADHEIGHIATFVPLVVMDVWEHAYMVDHKSNGRPAYIDAFMQNINWSIVEKRFNEAMQKKQKKI